MGVFTHKMYVQWDVPHKLTIVRKFHDGMMAHVLHDGDTSDAFSVTNGVKQRYVLAPTLFSTVFSAMLTDAFQDAEGGIHLRYRSDGRLFKLRCMQAVTTLPPHRLSTVGRRAFARCAWPDGL